MEMCSFLGHPVQIINGAVSYSLQVCSHLFDHLHCKLLMRDAFGQCALLLSGIGIQMIVNARQDAFLWQHIITSAPTQLLMLSLLPYYNAMSAPCTPMHE